MAADAFEVQIGPRMRPPDDCVAAWRVSVVPGEGSRFEMTAAIPRGRADSVDPNAVAPEAVHALVMQVLADRGSRPVPNELIEITPDG